MQTLIDADLITPFDDLINATPTGKDMLADFYPAFMANSQQDGKPMACPSSAARRSSTTTRICSRQPNSTRRRARRPGMTSWPTARS